VLKTALKNLMARKFRLVTTGFAVLLGVAFVAGTLVLTDTVSTSLNSMFADIFEDTDGYVRAEKAFEDAADEVRPLIDESLLDTVSQVDGVAVATPDVFGYAQILGSDGEPVGDPGQGPPTFGSNWTEDEVLNPFRLAEGRAPETGDEMVIDNYTAKEGDLDVGDTATVLTATGRIEAEIVGIAKFGEVDSPGGTTWAMFTTEAAQQHIGEAGKLSGITVLAEDGVSQDEVTKRIAEVLPEGHEAITGQDLTEENQDALQEFVNIFKTIMLVFALIAMFVGSFIIYNTFSILVAQRTRETALLRAIGATRRQVTLAVLLEAVVVGFIAALLGMVAGVGLAIGLQALLAGFGMDLPSSGLVIKFGTIVWSIVLGVVVCVFAAWAPARRGSKVPPIAAMRDVAFEQRGRPRLRLGIGATMLALGLLSLFAGLSGSTDNGLPLVGLGALLVVLAVTALGPIAARPLTSILGWPLSKRGVSGVLARENAMRNPKRTATTASALLIGVTLVSFITIFASSAKASVDKIFSDQFTGDFVLDSGTFGMGGAPTTLADELRNVDGIDAVSALRMTQAQVDGDEAFLSALDAVELERIVDIGLLEGDLADLGDDGIAVLDEEAEKQGWEIGTKVPIVFAAGGETEATVRAIYANVELADLYFVDTALFDANLTTQFDNMLFANIADGVDIDDVRPDVERVADEAPILEVQDRDEFIEAQGGFINQMLAMVYVLLSLAIIIALFGITNTLALSIVERTRELGLLRAVGMTRRQLRKMVRGEAMLIALFGTVGGLGVGTFFGWAVMQALADEGFKVFNVPVGQLVIIALLATGFGIAAALWPAHRASRLNVLHAIATD
jgi:putative ABC transport system permease protein